MANRGESVAWIHRFNVAVRRGDTADTAEAALSGRWISHAGVLRRGLEYKRNEFAEIAGCRQLDDSRFHACWALPVMRLSPEFLRRMATDASVALKPPI